MDARSQPLLCLLPAHAARVQPAAAALPAGPALRRARACGAGGAGRGKGGEGGAAGEPAAPLPQGAWGRGCRRLGAPRKEGRRLGAGPASDLVAGVSFQFHLLAGLGLDSPGCQQLVVTGAC